MEREMKKQEDVKQCIDKAEKELNEVFYDLIYEHGDNDGQYELNDLDSGLHTLLKYARKWQKIDKKKKSKSKKSLESSRKSNEEIVSKIRDMMFEEHKTIIKYRNLKKECEKRSDYSSAEDMEIYEKMHGERYAALASVLVCALDD